MALPISVGECLDLVDRGVKLYNKIKHEVPDLVAEVGNRIESLQLYLKRLQAFLQSGNLLIKTHPAEKNNLENVLGKIQVDVLKVVKILEKWETKEGPGGFELRFKFVAQALFALGSNPKELEDLGKKLDQRQDDIRDWMQLLLLWGQAGMLTVGKPPNRTPSPARSNYNIMFVDAENQGRSVVAEAYALLCREWTVRTGGQWPIIYIHSAGLHVRSRSGTASLQQQLGMTMFAGGKAPTEVAMSALFDSLPFSYGYKGDIRKRLSQRRSRGLTEDLFATYDFLIVFNRYNLASLENLRDALAKKQGQLVPPRKGKLVLLGGYGTTGSKEIFNARKGPDGNESVENWAITTSNIKTSFQNFLKNEFGWQQPAPEAKQDA